MKHVWLLLIVALLLAGCGGKNIFIDVEGGGWPDGTVVTAFSDDTVAGQAVLYGGSARLAVSGQGRFRLRCGGFGSLAVFTGTFEARQGVNHVTISAHVPRKRIDGRVFGIVFNETGQDSVMRRVMEIARPSVTTITLAAPGGIAREQFAQLITDMHTDQMEVLVAISLPSSPRTVATGEIVAGLDRLSGAGADGIVLDIGENVPDETTVALIRSFCEEAGERGLTVSIAAGTAGFDAGKWSAVMKNSGQAADVPVELRLVLSPAKDQRDSPNRTEPAIEALRSIAETGIPVNTCAVVFTMRASAFEQKPGGAEMATPEGGKLRTILGIAGGGVFTLQDGSRRFGWEGVTYAFDDIAGIVEKVRVIDRAVTERTGGVHIVYDESGAVIDKEGLLEIASALGRK